ncbi:MAG: hypothetical protein JST54_19060 [Deltaproteobacteria bacterium]|nr:hypothetical protein [Deltaproteobacteria bacterium]
MAAAESMNSRPTTGGALRLAEALIREAAIDGNQARNALARQAELGGWLGRHLVELGILDANRLADVLAKAFRCPRVVLAKIRPDPSALAMLDARICDELAMLPLALRESGEVLVVAVADPSQREALSRAAAAAGCTVRAVVCTEAEIRNGLGALAAHRPVAKRKAISFGPTEATPAMQLESLAESLSPANDPVGNTPANLPAAQRDPAVQLALLMEKLQATEHELRRTQEVLRSVVELVLEKGLATREELAARLAKR